MSPITELVRELASAIEELRTAKEAPVRDEIDRLNRLHDAASQVISGHLVTLAKVEATRGWCHCLKCCLRIPGNEKGRLAHRQPP